MCLFIIAADSIQFQGKEYVTINVAGPLKSTPTNDIKLRFKTTESNGLILSTLSESKRDHLMLEIHSTIIRLSINLGGGMNLSYNIAMLQNNCVDFLLSIDLFLAGVHAGIFAFFFLIKTVVEHKYGFL